MAGVPGPPVGKGGEGLGQSQQGIGLKSGPGHCKAPCEALLEAHGHPRTFLTQGTKDGAGQHTTEEFKLNHPSMHPSMQREPSQALKHVDFVLDLQKVSKCPRSNARKMSLDSCGSEDVISA